MPNTLTGLIPTIFAGLDVVSRELVGFIPAVERDASAERAALNQVIRVPITPAASTADNTPGVTPPDTGDQTITSVDMAITKSKHVPIRFNGEETMGLRSAGTYDSIVAGRFANAFRALVNEMERDLFLTAYRAASRATGTAGTAPLGTAGDLSPLANLARILDDNGAPVGTRRLVLGSAAVANIRGPQNMLLKLNESGSDVLLRTGSITDQPVTGFQLHYSGAVTPHVKGTGASYLTNGALAVGAATVAADTGSGTILAGDCVTYAADSANVYVANSALAAGSFTIGGPGVRVAIPDNNAITVGNDYTPNVAFASNAIKLLARAPAQPEGGDGADDAMMVVDPFTGIAFEVRVYRQFRQVVYHVAAAWGTAAIKSEHIATLRG